MVSITNKADFLNFWNKKVVEFENLHSYEILFREHAVFEAFLYYKHQYQKFQRYNKAADFITSIDGFLTSAPDRDMLAIKDDLDMNKYISRLENINKNHDWCIAYFGLHTVSAEIWDTARNFAKIIYENTNKKPTGRVDVDCFG